MSRPLVAKKTLDRTLVARARDIVFELTPDAVRYLGEVLHDTSRPDRARLKAAELILERTVPTLQSIKGVVQHLGDPNQPQVDWAKLRQEAIEQIQARQSEGGNGNGDRRIH